MDIDPSMIGLRSKPYTAVAEREKAREFAGAIGDLNPLYNDDNYASKTAYGEPAIPPTFLIALGNRAELPIRLDVRRMLHGEQAFINHRPVRYGEKLECTMVVADLYEKAGKSGTMQFLVLDTEMKDENGQLVAVAKNTIIYRPAKKPDQGGDRK